MAQELGNGEYAVASSQRRTKEAASRSGPARGSGRGPGRGENRGPSNRRPGGETAKLKSLSGYDTNLGRRKNPDTYPEGPGYRERSTQSERPADREVEAVYKKFSADFHDDLQHLIGMRKRRSSTQEFNNFLKDSGHSYYIDLFAKLTKAQEGTAGRRDGGNLHINEDAFKEFTEDPKAMAQIYKIRQQKLIEQAMAAAAAFSENPAAPEPGMIEPTSITLQPGGALRETGREIRNWWGKDRRPGNRNDVSRPQLLLGTNGRLTLTIGGMNIGLGGLGAGIGAAAGGPVGAAVGGVLGLVGAEGVVAISEAMKRGVRLNMDISPIALQTIIGDPTSSIAENRTANQAQLDWMKEFNNLAATDYEVIRGEVRRRPGIVGMTGVDKEKLAKVLAGTAKELLEFQAADGIPPEHRQVMDMSWIFEGTANRPQHGTEMERKIFERFNPDQGGIRDINGRFIDQEVQLRNPDVLVGQRTIGPGGEAAAYRQDAYWHFPANTNLPEGVWVPQYEDPPGSTNFIDAHVSILNENVPIEVNESRRFQRGDFMPPGTVIPPFDRREIGITGRTRRLVRVPQRVVTDPAGEIAAYDTGWTYQRYYRGDLIPAGTVIPEHMGPGTPRVDSAGNPITRLVRNRDFDWNRLDTIGNARRWMEAVEHVLEEENNEIFQDMVDGGTKYREKTFEALEERRKAGAKDGSEATKAKSKAEGRQRELTTDGEKIEGELDDITQYFEGVQKIRGLIKDAEDERTKEEAKVTVTVSGRRTGGPIPSAQEALAIVQTDDLTVTVTIDGEPITALKRLSEDYDKAVDKVYQTYRTKAVDKLQRIATNTKTAATNAEKKHRDAVTRGGYSRDQLALYAQEASDARADATQAQQALTAAETRASQYYDELKRNPQGNPELIDKKKKLDRLQELVATAAAAIKEKQEAVDTQTTALSSSETDHRTETEGIFTAMVEARNVLIRWGIPEADLAGAKNFDQLLKQINAQNSTNSAFGWPETGNSSERNRLLLLHAIAGEQARDTEPAVRNPSANFRDAINPAVWGLSEMDLLTLSLEQVKSRMDARRTALGRALPSDAEITGILEVAGKRSAAWQQMLERAQGEIEHRLKGVGKEITFIEENGVPMPLIERVLRARDRYDTIIVEIDSHLPDDRAIGEFLGNIKDAPAVGTPGMVGYVPATPANPENRNPRVENIDPDKFYEGVLEIIFDCQADTKAYYNGDTGPQAALAAAKELFPRKDLEILLMKKFGIAAPAGNTRMQNIVRGLLRQNNRDIRIGLSELFSEEVIYKYLAAKQTKL